MDKLDDELDAILGEFGEHYWNNVEFVGDMKSLFANTRLEIRKLFEDESKSTDSNSKDEPSS